ncbi:alpha-1,3-mannosyltransferase, partial [Phenoliferia sp. Uapishka_3]
MRRRKHSSTGSILRDSLPSADLPLLTNIVLYIKRKSSALISLLVGVLFGLFLAQALSPGDVAGEQWKGGVVAQTWSQRTAGAHRAQVSLPTLDQRARIFQLLATLTGHHTRYCLRKAQPAYRRQVYERYEPIVGYERRRTRRSPFGLLTGIVPKVARRSFFGFDEETEVEKIFSSANREGRNRKAQGKGLRPSYDGHKFFFAINLYNSFDVIPDLFSNMFKVSAIVGYHNVFVSVYENGSTDQTKALLHLFDTLCRAVGLRVVIRTSLRTRGAFHHRIEYLAEVRNEALAPLQELRDAEGEYFDSIIFMNDVLPWVARDMNGTALENAPFEAVFRDVDSSHRFQRHLPIQVQSCWNGIAILDPAPMYTVPHVQFRMAKLSAGECSASECSLICNDYWNAGFGRIIMIPRVKLAYDKVRHLTSFLHFPSFAHVRGFPFPVQQVWDIIHPERRNLTYIRGYTRLGGETDDPHSDPQDRGWHGPHDRLFRAEESEAINFRKPPPYVWCWGWDGAGDLEGPDVEPIWEAMPNTTFDPRVVRHDRSFSDL